MNKVLTLSLAVVAAVLFSSSASAQWGHYSRGHGGHHYGGYGNSGIGLHVGGLGIHVSSSPRSYSTQRFSVPRYSTSRYSTRRYSTYRPTTRVWHDTTHLDYHGPSVVRHGNHYDYQPAHYDVHRTGHYDHH